MTGGDEQALIEEFVDVGLEAAERDLLPRAMMSLVSRLRTVANTECGTPPDLDGLCLRCGRKTAEPIQAHKPGCSIFDVVAWPIFRARRVATRTSRLGRLMWAAAIRGRD